MIGVALALAGQVEIWAPAAAIGVDEPLGSRPILAATALLTTLPLAVRRSAPLVSCGLAMAGLAIQGLATTPTQGLTTLIALVVSVYSVSTYAGRRASIVGGVLALAAVVPVANDLADWTFSALLIAAAWLGGTALRRRAAQVRSLGERTNLLEAQAVETARVAVEEERARIARELHDIVAHRVSMMVVQAQAADALLGKDPDGARDALGAIDESGRQALAELRALLGLLRENTGDAAREPQPDLGRIPMLVDEIRATGVEVTLDVHGEPRPVPAGVGVTAYRIVQEALTNVIKHADSSPTQVDLRYLTGALEIVVTDRGVGRQEPGLAGHGLLGMRERVALYGGSLDAGPCHEGGFMVRANLPMTVARP